MKTETSDETDIAIVGAGVAGCTAAIALAQSHSVVLIDKLSAPIVRVGECLAPAARRILKQLDLLAGLEERHIPYTERKIQQANHGTASYWGSEQVHFVDHIRNPDGLGWHLDRQAFEAYLRDAAMQRGVNCLWPAKLDDSHYEDLHWHIVAKPTDKTVNQQTHHIKAKFVIDASGRQSHFARQLGVEREHIDRLIACWATLPDSEQTKLSTISASEYGWWYSAPLPNNRRVLALQTDSDLIDRDALKKTNQFIELAKANRAMAKILEKSQGKIEFHGIVAANSTRLNQVMGQQWAALGDAAMSFDPLSSQGMFNAMASASQLTSLMRDSCILSHPDSETMQRLQASYNHQTDQIWAHYIRHKNIFYHEERRWKDSVFWKRRH